jgi:hypothetical protein|tara:strand:+ start:38 stop:217 length:180 start_codon:yes stop_codon:yes gene_type:complete
MKSKEKSMWNPIGLCVLAFVFGFFMATTIGCSATNETKVHTGSKTFAGAVGVGIRAEGE